MGKINYLNRSSPIIAGKNSEWFHEVAKGNITGYSPIFLSSTSLNITTTESTLWYPAYNYKFPTTTDVVTIVSTSTNDSSTGTGARTMLLNGLDDNKNAQVEIITLDGTNPVVSDFTWSRMNTTTVLTVGSLTINEGDISVTHPSLTSPEDIISWIQNGEGLSRQTVYSPPIDTTLFVEDGNVYLDKDQRVEIIPRVRFEGLSEATLVTSRLPIYETPANFTQIPPALITGGSDVKINIRALALGLNKQASAIYQFIQVLNTEL